jgi:hypothetical protein
MDERLRFVARLLEGEKMAVLCREFDISRKTGYKIFQRYKDCGLQGLGVRPSQGRPHRQWRAFCQCPRPIRTEQAGGMVAAPRNPNRAHQAGTPAAEWPSRAHAPDA